jgi:beta-glucosidase
MMKKTMMTFALLIVASVAMAQQRPMKEYIDGLMSKMTLQEKIGQLNLMVAGDITTGGAMDTQVGGDIARGNIGGVFNIKGVDKIRALQDLAVKKSRLGIPLIVGMDVIHGYETIFPIPLALSCSWDIPAIEHSAQYRSQGMQRRRNQLDI